MRPRSVRRPRREGEGRIRRDPRAERLQGAAPADAVEPTGPTGRPRRDPRALRTGTPHPVSGRPRIDRARPALATAYKVAVAPAASAAPAPRVREVVIEQPACWVLAVPDLAGGRLSSHDRDVLGAARILADAGEGAVVAVVFGTADDLGAAGADRVIRFDDPAFQGYAPEARTTAVVRLMEAMAPRHVVFPDTVTGGGDLGRRVAALTDQSLATEVIKLGAGEVVSRGNGGRSDFVMAPPRLVLLASEGADPVVGARHEARAMEAPAVAPDPRLVDEGPIAVDPNAIPLAEADFIVSAGNGVTDWAAFHAVAAALGATEGGSRVVCDAGLLPRDRQVGASGTLVDPRCYLAFGIAGAPQHLQGITRCERVVAVNTDLHAEMIKRADLAIVQDAQTVMPALTRMMEEKRRDR